MACEALREFTECGPGLGLLINHGYQGRQAPHRLQNMLWESDGIDVYE